MRWINVFNSIIVVLLLAPNIIFAFKNRDARSIPKSPGAAGIAEQIGRYGSIFFMVSGIGVPELGFRSMEDFAAWLFCVSVLVLLYWLFWIFYFKRRGLFNAIALAVIPSAVFLMTGLFLSHWALVLFAAVFCVSHIYVVYGNHRKE